MCRQSLIAGQERLSDDISRRHEEAPAARDDRSPKKVDGKERKDVVDSDARPDVRRNAARALGIIGARDAIPKLTNAVRTERDKPARLASMQALTAMGSDAAAAVPALLDVLASSDSELRVEAAVCLGVIGHGDRDAVTALMASLDDSDARVRANRRSGARR